MSEEARNRDILEKKAIELDFSLFGVADITRIREKFYLDEKRR